MERYKSEYLGLVNKEDIKICIVGDSNAGKSQLLSTYLTRIPITEEQPATATSKSKLSVCIA